MISHLVRLSAIVRRRPWLAIVAGVLAGLFGLGLDLAASDRLSLAPATWGLAAALFGACVGLSPSVVNFISGRSRAHRR